MKKIILLFALLLLFSCNREPLLPYECPSVKQIADVKRNGISISDICDYIEKASGAVSTKGTYYSVEPVLSEGDTVLYVVNYEKGWEILSADRRAPRCFAMSEGGSLSVSQISEVPALEGLYEEFKSNVLYLKRNPGLVVDSDFADKWEKETSRGLEIGFDWELIDSLSYQTFITQDHLTETRWGQGNPWNIRSPYTDSSLSNHCVTGCVPTAAAQVLYYLNQTMIGTPALAYGDCVNNSYIPTGAQYLILNSNDVIFDSSTLSSSTWGTMPLTNTGSGSFAAVSTLMTQLGLYLGARYKTNGTGARTRDVPDVLSNNYGVTCCGDSTINYQTISNQIIAQLKPVILSVSFYENGVRNGHCVVADACQNVYNVTKYYYRRPVPSLFGDPAPVEWEYKVETVSSFAGRYLGINWGWNGLFMESGGEPVWFSTDAISWSTGSYCFTSVDYMVYGFSASLQ